MDKKHIEKKKKLEDLEKWNEKRQQSLMQARKKSKVTEFIQNNFKSTKNTREKIKKFYELYNLQ